MPEVVLGGQSVTLPPLTGFKGVRAGRIASQITRAVPDVMERWADFNRTYREQNVLVVTPELAQLRRYERDEVDDDGNVTTVPLFSAEDFDRAGGVIRIPQEPTVAEQFAALFPVVWGAAESSVVELLALTLAPNDELADADERGEVDGYLAARGRRLLHESQLNELVDLAVTVGQLIRSSFDGIGGDALERLTAVVTGPTQTDEPDLTPSVGSTPTPESTPPSPTASPEPTGGTVAPSSTEPSGTNSGVSSGT